MFPLLVYLYFKSYFPEKHQQCKYFKSDFPHSQNTRYKFSLYLSNRFKTYYNLYIRSHTVIIFLVFISQKEKFTPDRAR